MASWRPDPDDDATTIPGVRLLRVLHRGHSGLVLVGVPERSAGSADHPAPDARAAAPVEGGQPAAEARVWAVAVRTDPDRAAHEIRVLADLATAGVPGVPVLDGVTAVAGRSILMTRLVAGVTLRSLVSGGSAAAGRRVRRALSELAETVGAAHAAGIAHGRLAARRILVAHGEEGAGPVLPQRTILLGWRGAHRESGGAAVSEARRARWLESAACREDRRRWGEILDEAGAVHPRDAALRRAREAFGRGATWQELARLLAAESSKGESLADVPFESAGSGDGAAGARALRPVLFDAPEPTAIVDGTAARLREEQQAPVGRVHALTSRFLNDDLVERIDLVLAGLGRRLRALPRGVWIAAAGAATAILVVGASLGDRGGDVDEAGHAGGAPTISSSEEEPAGEGAPEDGDQPGDPIVGTSPADAALALLERRRHCLHEASLLCLDAVVQAGSPLQSSDRAALVSIEQGGEGGGLPHDLVLAHPALSLQADALVVVEEVGGVVVLSYEFAGNDGEGAATGRLWLIRSADGWRLREIMDLTEPPG